MIQGRKRDEDAEGEMLHVGIANRGFERRFELADFVRVENADLADGLLVIDLVREVPEAMKPKKIVDRRPADARSWSRTMQRRRQADAA